MSLKRFDARLAQAQQLHGSDRALLLVPRFARMPLPMQRIDDPFLPFGKAIIDATRDLVCAYVFDLATYLVLGAAGAVALERTIAYAGTDDATVTVLHAPFVGIEYAQAAAAFNVDAVTLVDELDAAAYGAAGLGVFVVGKQIEGTLTSVDGAQMRLLGEQVLYTGHGDNFAEQVRAVVEAS